MSEPIIRIKNLSKRYKITQQQGGYVALRDVLTNVAKRPFSFAKQKVKIIIGRGKKEEFWALKNINLDIQKGDIIGIIGRNGAGKSTLLKILAEITSPTTGEAEINGTVASLLEVGTGFHPELTGRENIFLNGAILGMSKEEIIRKFDQIVEFSGVQKFLDTPVKRYSTGMSVRLAFSVTAHLEPDILLVDEVLAVGDTEFQKKCMGKMNEVTKTAGRTILFVSHNMEAILQLCPKTILLENGQVKMFDETKKVVGHYLSRNPLSQNGIEIKNKNDRRGGEKVRLTSFHVESQGKKINEIFTGGDYTFCFGYETMDGQPVKDLSCAFSFIFDGNKPLILNWSKLTGQAIDLAPAKGIIKCHIIQRFPLAEGIYDIDPSLWIGDERCDYIKNFLTFEVKRGNFYNDKTQIKNSPLSLPQDWSFE